MDLRELLDQKPIVIISDGGPSRRDGLLEGKVTSALTSGAAGMVIVREQLRGTETAEASDREVLLLLQALHPRCRAAGALLLVHGRPDLVLAAGIDGAHLGGHSLPVSEVRKLLPDIIGVSAHSEAEVALAAREGASYVLFSPIFSPRSKPETRPPVGIDGLAAVCRVAELPVIALGGIGPENIKACREAGAAGAAVIGEVFSAGNPSEAVRKLAESWNRS